MKKISTIKRVTGHLDKAIKEFGVKHKIIELVNRRETKYGYEKVEVIWENKIS